MHGLKRLPASMMLRGEHYNQILDALQQLSRIHASGGYTESYTHAAGTFVRHRPYKITESTGGVGGGGTWPESRVVDLLVGRVTEYELVNVAQWVYTVAAQKKHGVEYGAHGATWRDTGKTVAAYNLLENDNVVGAEVYGNGVRQANLDSIGGSFALQPVPIGALVMCFGIKNDTTNATEYWFAYENGVDGECPIEEPAQ